MNTTSKIKRDEIPMIKGLAMSCHPNEGFADLRDADIRWADLRDADLRGADLRGANLSDADLRDADIRDANIRLAKIDYPMVCPEKGSFIGFKRTKGYIVELEICSDAKRSSATTRKCRCSKAKVISITNSDGSNANVVKVFSCWDENFSYEVGKIVCVDDFDENRWNECTTGIHFFMTRQEAIDYKF